MSPGLLHCKHLLKKDVPNMHGERGVVPALWTFVQSEKISLPPRNGLPELTDFSTAIPLLRATVRDRTVYWVSGTSMKGVYPLITIIQKPGHMHS
ncbi:uncharacterized protein M6G45_006154 isoform 3-T6 [Spheniscus humboldti]